MTEKDKSGVKAKTIGRKPKVAPKKKAAARKSTAKSATAKKETGKSVASKSSARKNAAKTKKTKPAAKKAIKRSISAEEHYQMVQTAAYFRAQRDGFKGDAMKYWIEAENEIKALLN